MNGAAGLHAELAWRRGATALEISMDLPPRGISVLFGPSGAGKTSCLRAVAGFEPAARGRIAFRGEVWQDSGARRFVPAPRRRIGYVAQDAGLFEHLSVAGNLDYGYRRAGRPAHLDRESLVDRFGVRALLSRRVGALSGGERQRVAIVRALLRDPALLLFDEPLSALDAASREDLLGQLEAFHAELSVPALYVSHAIDEVARLADHLVLIDAGRIVAQGTLQETLARPDLPPALREAAGTVIEGTVTRHFADEHLTEVAFDGGKLLLPSRGAAPGQRLRCRIGARDVVLARHPQDHSSALNQFQGQVVAMAEADHPSQCLVQLRVGANLLLARITRRSWQALELAPGSEIWAQVKAVALGGA